MRIDQLLKIATKNIDSLDAELIIAHVLQKSREFLVSHPDFKIGRLKDWKIKRLFKKRSRGVPLAYLTGHKEFFGLDFEVNKHILIPRPDTEIMVEAVLEKINKIKRLKDYKITLVDVGTGSGCIPISILKSSNLSIFKSFAIDISRKALKVAHTNAMKHNVNITFLHGNLLSPISNFKFQISNLFVTANLPYLTLKQFQNEPSIQHEPKSALIAESNGLALYEELLQQIKNILISQYPISLFLEIDPSQIHKMIKLVQMYIPNATIEIKKDLAGLDRVVIIEM